MTSTIKLIIIAIIFAVVTGVGYTTYNHIKDIGFQEAKVICDENFKKYEEQRSKKISEIETESKDLAAQSKLREGELTKKMTLLKKQLKIKPLVLVKEGKCTLTQEFSDSFGKINQTANQSMKGNQK